MKRIIPILLIFLCIITYYCSKNNELDFENNIDEYEGNLRAPDEVLLNQSVLYLHKGDTAQLEAIVLPINSIKTLCWVSQNTDVVSVDQGTVIGKNIGQTYVVASTILGGVSAVCSVHVIDIKKVIPKQSQ